MATFGVADYYRKVTLPAPVEGVLANVTHGNGVLVVALPDRGAHEVGYAHTGCPITNAWPARESHGASPFAPTRGASRGCFHPHMTHPRERASPDNRQRVPVGCAAACASGSRLARRVCLSRATARRRS